MHGDSFIHSKICKHSCASNSYQRTCPRCRNSPDIAGQTLHVDHSRNACSTGVISTASETTPDETEQLLDLLGESGSNEAMYDHVTRDAGLQPHARVADLRSPCNNTRNNVGDSANGALLAAASPQRKLKSASGLSRGACARLLQSQHSCSVAPPHSQATRELRARRVSGGAARSSAALRQQPSLLSWRGASWQGSGSQRNRGQWQFARAETQFFGRGRWPATGRS